jgi:hypothetical protein
METLQAVPERREVNLDPQLLPQLDQRRIGFFPQQDAQPFVMLGRQQGLASAAMRFGFQRTAFSTPLLQLFNKGRADREALCDLGDRLTFLAGLDQPLAQIHRIGFRLEARLLQQKTRFVQSLEVSLEIIWKALEQHNLLVSRPGSD